MEFGLSRTIQLASSLLAGLRPAHELVADLVSDLLQTVSRYLNMSRDSSHLVADQFTAGLRLRPARELVCDLLVSC